MIFAAISGVDSLADPVHPIGKLHAFAQAKLDLDESELPWLLDFVKILPNEYHEDLQIHLLLLILHLSRQQGSSGVKLTADGLAAHLGSASSWPDFLNENFLQSICTKIIQGHWSFWISTPADLYHPVILDQGRLFFQKDWLIHSEFEILLHARMSEGIASPIHQEPFRKVLKEVLQDSPLLIPGPHMSTMMPIALSKEQIQAVALGLISKTILITGGPGTGKTSVLTNIMRSLVRLRMPTGAVRAKGIYMLAPTGKAAQRLQDSFQSNLRSIKAMDAADEQLLELVRAQTMHKFLRISPGRSFYSDHALKCDADLVIVDEVSMVDKALMLELLRALPPHCRLIMAGDPQQLPPVQQGGFLPELVSIHPPQVSQSVDSWILPFISPNAMASDAVATETIHGNRPDFHVRLHREFRSADELQLVAGKILQGHFSCKLDLPANQRINLEAFQNVNFLSNAMGFTLVEPGEIPSSSFSFHKSLASAWWHMRLQALEISAHKELTQIFSILRQREHAEFTALLSTAFETQRQWQILAITHHGDCGTKAINRHLNDEMAKFQPSIGHSGLHHGAPVLICRNDESTQLSNGDMGLYLELLDENGTHPTAVFQSGSGFKFLPLASLPHFEPGYAMTVHKTQGSEYNHVLLLLPLSDHRLLRREILFTAITRARQKMVIGGPASMLEMGSSRSLHGYAN